MIKSINNFTIKLIFNPYPSKNQGLEKRDSGWLD